jgi:AraC-like DNA-binding protein
VSVRGAPAAELRGWVSGYYGFREVTPSPIRRQEGPGQNVVLIVSFGEEWLIDGNRCTSFAAGLHDRQVTTEHAGHSYGMHIDLAPQAAHMLFGLPMHTLARRVVTLEDVLDEPSFVERLHDAGDWLARFRLLDEILLKRLAAAPPPTREVVWAWRRLVESGGGVAIGALAQELGWSRKRIVARFREEVGLPPKAMARLLRFERARELAAREERPDWSRIAVECGYYDQSHLINDFRAVTRRTPETFFQDPTAPAS